MPWVYPSFPAMASPDDLQCFFCFFLKILPKFISDSHLRHLQKCVELRNVETNGRVSHVFSHVDVFGEREAIFGFQGACLLQSLCSMGFERIPLWSGIRCGAGRGNLCKNDGFWWFLWSFKFTFFFVELTGSVHLWALWWNGLRQGRHQPMFWRRLGFVFPWWRRTFLVFIAYCALYLNWSLKNVSLNVIGLLLKNRATLSSVWVLSFKVARPLRRLHRRKAPTL